MASNRSIIEKIATSDFTNGGLLNPTQSNRFIDYMVPKDSFLADIRTVRMNGPQYDLDFMGLGSRILREGTEGTAPTTLANVTTSRKRLTTKEVILPYDITDNVREDNIEGVSVADHIASLMGAQFGNDLADLAINGDTATASNATDYAFLKIADGFIKLAKNSTLTHKVNTAAGVDYKGTIFPNMLKAVPNQFKANKSLLRFYVSPTVAEAYVDQLDTRSTALGDASIVSGNIQPFHGVRLFPVEFLPDDVLILTPAQNLAVGIQRQVRVENMRQPRKRLTEYTITMRLDFAKIVYDPALVIAYNTGA